MDIFNFCMGSVDIATSFSKISEPSTVATRPPEGPAGIVKDVQTFEANFRYCSPNYHGTSKKAFPRGNSS